MKDIFKRHPRYHAAPEDFSGMPEDLWERCPRCKELLYARELEAAMRVCTKCKYHFPLTARERAHLTLDPDSFCERDVSVRSVDPLHFDGGGETYKEKLIEYGNRAESREAFIYGIGRIGGQDVVMGLTEFKFAGGSMGAVFGEKLARAFELAEREALPLIVFSSSGGARMQEGAISLLQMAKTVTALDRLKASGLPFISVMTDPCLGGVTASYAMLGDVNIAEPGAYVGFAGRRVIEQTMRQNLPKDAATAEFLLKHGMLDMVVGRTEMVGVLGRLVRMLATSNLAVQTRRRTEQHVGV